MGILEKLGITPGLWKVTKTGDEDIETYIIAAAPEMLEALIEELLFIEENTISSLHSEGDPYEKMKAIIEKATGKTWEEIKEIIND